jgi:hypothetical protein
VIVDSTTEMPPKFHDEITEAFFKVTYVVAVDNAPLIESDKFLGAPKKMFEPDVLRITWAWDVAEPGWYLFEVCVRGDDSWARRAIDCDEDRIDAAEAKAYPWINERMLDTKRRLPTLTRTLHADIHGLTVTQDLSATGVEH